MRKYWEETGEALIWQDVLRNHIAINVNLIKMINLYYLVDLSQLQFIYSFQIDFNRRAFKLTSGKVTRIRGNYIHLLNSFPLYFSNFNAYLDK